MPHPSDALLPPELPAARVACRLGLVSDTHMPDRLAALPAALFAVLRGVDLVLHAGDVGELQMLDQLSVIAPVVAVHGNDETDAAQRVLPYRQTITAAGARIVLTHAHYPDRAEELASRQDDDWGPKLERRAALGREAGASIVVFGHTHIPLALRHDGILLVNPGALASGNATSRQLRRTVAILYLRDDGAPFVVHVDLATPDQPFAPAIDLTAGFKAALDRFSASILAPDLAVRLDELRAIVWPLPVEERRALFDMLHVVARRCWAGEQEAITRADLLDVVRADGSLPAATRRGLEAILRRE